MKTLLQLFMMATLALFYSNCKNETKAQPSATPEAVPIDSKKTGQAFIEDEGATPNALKLAMSSPDHTTLVAAVQAAGVENALVNVGPLTVFAPTNAAFDKIDKATLEDLLKLENKSALSKILLHHVAPSNYPIQTLEKNVEKNRKLYMADGHYLEVTKQGEDIYVGGTKIIATVNVSNGWVHIVDDVLLHKE